MAWTTGIPWFWIHHSSLVINRCWQLKCDSYSATQKTIFPCWCATILLKKRRFDVKRRTKATPAATHREVHQSAGQWCFLIDKQFNNCALEWLMVASPNKLKSIGRIFFWGISSAFSYQPEQSNQSFQRKIALRLKKPLETHFVTCFLEHIYTQKTLVHML